MDDVLENALFENYPSVFELAINYSDEDGPTPTITLYGVQCDNGWYRIIDAVSAEIERYNDEAKEPVHAVQIKEKFGELRFYTNHTPKELQPMIRMATTLSNRTCELCGDMETARPRKERRRRIKTLCDTHTYAERDLSGPIEIWKFPMTCFKCDASNHVVYPRGLGGSEGGTWRSVGPKLATKDYCTVERHYSDTQKLFVWGNSCEQCGIYLGNFFVYSDAMEYASDGWKDRENFTKVDSIEFSEDI